MLENRSVPPDTILPRNRCVSSTDSPGNAPWIASFRDPAGNLLGLYQEGPRVGTQ